MNRQAASALVAPFYDALNTPAQKAVAALVGSVASPDWRSFAGETVSKGREEFIGQVIGFGRLIPDLKWDIKEVLVDGDRIIVRSEASGTPAGDFMGVPHGGRRFAIMTIDIHTVKDGQLVAAHHVEDWASALRQLRG
jgi:predicted ester cyclase